MRAISAGPADGSARYIRGRPLTILATAPRRAWHSPSRWSPASTAHEPTRRRCADRAAGTRPWAPRSAPGRRSARSRRDRAACNASQKVTATAPLSWLVNSTLGSPPPPHVSGNSCGTASSMRSVGAVQKLPPSRRPACDQAAPGAQPASGFRAEAADELDASLRGPFSHVCLVSHPVGPRPASPDDIASATVTPAHTEKSEEPPRASDHVVQPDRYA